MVTRTSRRVTRRSASLRISCLCVPQCLQERLSMLRASGPSGPIRSRTRLQVQIQEDPRPIIERRREQGMYTSYLAGRCRDLREELAMLLDSMGARPTERRPRRYGSLLMHRWNHDFTSKYSRLTDAVGSAMDAGAYHLGRDAVFVNTSYWMPERPDLRALLPMRSRIA